MENNKIEVIVVGAGPAGVSAAITLARAGKKVLLVERGDCAGDKNIFGGTIYAKQTAEIFPRFWETAPVERTITEQKIFLLTDYNSTQFSYKYASKGAYKAFTVNRAKWDKWCTQQAELEGVYFTPKTLVKELILKDRKVIGIKTEFEEFYSDIVIIADGVNSLLAKQIGLRKEIKDSDVSLSVKEVIKINKEKLEDRFNLDEEDGCACKILGGPLRDKFALGFMYTNKDTISIGYSISLDEIKKLKVKPYELLDELKAHPTVSAYIKNGETIEYSSHLIPEGGYNAIPKLYDNGVMIIGDAAMLVNNIHFEGTNLAMLSGKLAAETAIEAINNNDFSKSSLSKYHTKLKESIILKDLKTHRNTIEVIKKNIHTLSSLYPELACEFLEILTSADGVEKKVKYRKFLKEIIKKGTITSSIPLAILAMEKCLKK